MTSNLGFRDSTLPYCRKPCQPCDRCTAYTTPPDVRSVRSCAYQSVARQPRRGSKTIGPTLPDGDSKSGMPSRRRCTRRIVTSPTPSRRMNRRLVPATANNSARCLIPFALPFGVLLTIICSDPSSLENILLRTHAHLPKKLSAHPNTAPGSRMNGYSS